MQSAVAQNVKGTNPKPRTFSLHAPRPPGEASFLLVTLPRGRFWVPGSSILGILRACLALFPVILAFWVSILAIWGFHFLSYWPFGPSFPFILAFWAFISFHFGFLGLHFLSFWPFGPSFPFILAFWAFISFILACQKGHLARIWPTIAIFPLNFAIFPFPKFAFWGGKLWGKRPVFPWQGDTPFRNFRKRKRGEATSTRV